MKGSDKESPNLSRMENEEVVKVTEAEAIEAINKGSYNGQRIKGTDIFWEPDEKGLMRRMVNLHVLKKSDGNQG